MDCAIYGENSVGRLWQESYPESKAAESWRYYLEPVEQEPEIQAKLDALKNPNPKPEDITVMERIMQKMIQFNEPQRCCA